MLISELKPIKECCFKCKFSRYQEEKIPTREVPTNFIKEGFPSILFTPKEKEKYYPELDDSLLVKSIYHSIHNVTCNKLPPKNNGFPRVEANSWCGSYKEREAE